MQKQTAPAFSTVATNNALEEASRLALPERTAWLNSNLSELPDNLYKYLSLNPEDNCSVEKLRDTIVNSCLWLSPPTHFNDPFDMTLHLELERDPIKLRETMKSGFKRFNPEAGYKARAEFVEKHMANLDGFKQHVHERYREKIESAGVCCLSRDPENILMWSHYAEKHTGFAMQFSVVQDVHVFARSLPVEYSQDYPVVLWPSDSEELNKKIILGKHDGWKYEQEFRIIHNSGSNTLLPFRPEALTGIYIGCRTPAESFAKLQELLLERKSLGYPAPQLYRVNRHPKKFELQIEQV